MNKSQEEIINGVRYVKVERQYDFVFYFPDDYEKYSEKKPLYSFRFPKPGKGDGISYQYWTWTRGAPPYKDQLCKVLDEPNKETFFRKLKLMAFK